MSPYLESLNQAYRAHGGGVSIYPYKASYKQEGTSSEAAHKINRTGRADTLRKMVYQCIVLSIHGLTADEVAQSLNESVLSIRPRLSELRKQNRIKESGQRRTNSSGMTANVWVMS